MYRHYYESVNGGELACIDEQIPFDIPDTWEWSRLSSVLLIARGGSPRPIKDYLTNDENGVNWIKIGDTTKGSKYIFTTREKIKPEGIAKSRLVKPGDFLLSNSMSFGRPYILRTSGCIHDGWLVIRDSNGLFNKNYLYYYLSSNDLYCEFKKLAVGGVVNNLNSDIVRNVQVAIPPLSIQRSIVSELDLLHSLIEKKQEQLRALDNLAQSLFYQMFGDPITNPMGWQVKKLGEVCGLKAGKSIKAVELQDYCEGLYPCYGGNGIRGYIGKYSHTENHSIIGRQGALCGNINYAIAPFYATEHAVVVTPLISMNDVWLFYSLMNLKLEQYAHGVAQPGLSVQDLVPISLPLPPLSLQQSFAAKVSAIEEQKRFISQSIKDVESLLAQRMDHYFG